MIMFYADLIFSYIGVLLSIAFFTLMERKLMGLAHYRKGPNKVLLWGISQPIADATKLLTKEYTKLSFLKYSMFNSGPSTSILLMLLCWGWYEFSSSITPTSMKIMIIVSLMSLTAYGFILMSWGSNSKYSLVGGYRAVAQIISYEVCMVIFMMIIFYLCKSFKMSDLKELQENMWFMFSFYPTFLCWTLLCMAESNRTPFDTAEGESEIVSGFNIEYGGGLFALIFISEYGMIMLMSFLSSLIFLGGMTMLMVKTFAFCTLYIWVRCAFPRVRYDNLMMMCWKVSLPYSLSAIMIMSIN
uniref:NADH-ubiquinone oxidoreductase chain 1 n=1 Tax=Thyreophagus entomophagus TaxID=2874286 RepID=A0A977PLM2_9ACAR|nr:NADH dehydrogenase subunit 1 [Thyreophagus entomophagus]UXD78886.1 NADH dehydrogenase subunit 1 [Thyreophagus entomophagus]